MYEENPDRVQRHGEEMTEEQDGICRKTGRSNEDISPRSKIGTPRGIDGDSPREQRDGTSDAFAAALKVFEAPGPQMREVLVCVPAYIIHKHQSDCRKSYAAHTVGAKEVIQRDTQDVDRRCERLTRPMPPVENVRECVPVGEVGFCGDHWREEHDVREGDGHATACERVAHVPCVAEEDDALLGMRSTLLDRWEERVGHAPETVFR